MRDDAGEVVDALAAGGGSAERLGIQHVPLDGLDSRTAKLLRVARATDEGADRLVVFVEKRVEQVSAEESGRSGDQNGH